MHLSRVIEDVVRNDGRRILASLIRLTGDFDRAEDALQEAYTRAFEAWQRDGIPDRADAWLYTVARRVAIDRIRRDRTIALPDGLELSVEPVEDVDLSEVEDDRLRLLFICCHPALAPEARCTLALRTLAGLTTREIARAFIEPEATTAQRLVRAKRKIAEAKIPYEMPQKSKLPERIETVLSVLYFLFNEGYSSTEGQSLLRPDLSTEAIRLARLAVELIPDSTEARGLLALMLLVEARKEARVDANGDLVALEDQDRSRWDRRLIEEGVRILDTALAERKPGPYQTQAAIAALHAEAATPDATDWPQIAALYRTLTRWEPTPVVALNHAVANAMAGARDEALRAIEALERAGELDSYYLLPAAKADLLRRSGRHAEAAVAYEAALALVRNPAERRYLERRLRELGAPVE